MTTWARRDDVALAAFPGTTVAFQASDCRMLELNDIAAAILTAVASPASEQELVGVLARTENIAHAEVRPGELRDVLAELHRLRLVKRRVDGLWQHKERLSMTEQTRFLANPDVSCRIEDDDGAILYNPDVQSCQVINAVGLELWQYLSEPRRRDELVEHLCATYDGATPADAASDVGPFLDQLLAYGFVGEVQEGGPDGV